MLWFLRHTKRSLHIAARDFRQAQRDYYFQERDEEGQIPWRLFCGEYEVNPATGEIFCHAVHV